MRTIHKDTITTPIGDIVILFDPKTDTLLFLDFGENHERFKRLTAKRFAGCTIEHSVSDHLHRQLMAYFDGDTTAFDDIKTALGGSAFQQKVWQYLRCIPAGQTLSYKQLAEKLGNPNAVRAVARANALNPVSLVHPCHRIIGHDGSLRGYAGGLARKEWLLAHEGGYGQPKLFA